MDPVVRSTTHDDDTEISYVTYHFFDTILCLLVSNQFHSPSSADLFNWDKVWFLFTRTKGLPSLFSKIPDAAVSSLNIILSSAPSSEDPINVYDMDVA